MITDFRFNMGIDIMIAIILFVKCCMLLSHDLSDFTNLFQNQSEICTML